MIVVDEHPTLYQSAPSFSPRLYDPESLRDTDDLGSGDLEGVGLASPEHDERVDERNRIAFGVMEEIVSRAPA